MEYTAASFRDVPAGPDVSKGEDSNIRRVFPDAVKIPVAVVRRGNLVADVLQRRSNQKHGCPLGTVFVAKM